MMSGALSDPATGIRFFEFHKRLARLLNREMHQVDLLPKNYLHRVMRDRVPAETQRTYAAA